MKKDYNLEKFKVPTGKFRAKCSTFLVLLLLFVNNSLYLKGSSMNSQNSQKKTGNYKKRRLR